MAQAWLILDEENGGLFNHKAILPQGSGPRHAPRPVRGEFCKGNTTDDMFIHTPQGLSVDNLCKGNITDDMFFYLYVKKKFSLPGPVQRDGGTRLASELATGIEIAYLLDTGRDRSKPEGRRRWRAYAFDVRHTQGHTYAGKTRQQCHRKDPTTWRGTIVTSPATPTWRSM